MKTSQVRTLYWRVWNPNKRILMHQLYVWLTLQSIEMFYDNRARPKFSDRLKGIGASVKTHLTPQHHHNNKSRKELYWWWVMNRCSNRHARRRTCERKLRSRIWWFTEFCNSHYVSHFAALVIVARTEISVVKSCLCVFAFVCFQEPYDWLS